MSASEHFHHEHPAVRTYARFKEVNLGPYKDFPVGFDQLKTYVTTHAAENPHDEEINRKLETVNGIDRLFRHMHVGYGFMQIPQTAAEFIIKAVSFQLTEEFRPEIQALAESNRNDFLSTQPQK